MATEDVTPEQAEQMYHDVRALPSKFDRDTAFAMDRRYLSDPFGPARRVALLLLAESAVKLFDKVQGDRSAAVAMASMVDAMRDYREWLEFVQEIAKEAEMRITIALCAREDMREVLAEVAARGGQMSGGLQ